MAKDPPLGCTASKWWF